MVAAEGPPPCELHYAWNLCNLNEMNAAPEPRQQNELPSFPNSYFDTSKVAFPGPSISVKRGSKIDQTNGVHMFQNLPPLVASSCPITDSFVKESQNGLSNQFGVKATPNNASGSCQKQFIIFDRSGDETRMIVSPFPSLVQNQIALGKSSFNAYNVRDENVEMEKIFPMKLINQEKVDENTIFGEASEMHEDTEEINALLYSDDSDEDHYSSDDEDEVTSTGHSPLETKWDYDKHGQISNVADELATSDGSSKRLKLLDGGYKKSSLVDAASSMKLIRSFDHNNDAESSYGICKNLSQDMDSVSSAWEKKVKIHETLKVLEKIVPGLTSNNPLLIIDGAIDYLKSLRLKAETLGVCYSQVHTTFPN